MISILKQHIMVETTKKKKRGIRTGGKISQKSVKFSEILKTPHPPFEVAFHTFTTCCIIYMAIRHERTT